MFKHIVECNRCSVIVLDPCIYVVYSMSTSLKKVEITKYQYSNRSRGRHNDPPQVAPGGTGAPEHHLIKQNFNIMQNGHLENGKKGNTAWSRLLVGSYKPTMQQRLVKFIGIHWVFVYV